MLLSIAKARPENLELVASQLTTHEGAEETERSGAEESADMGLKEEGEGEERSEEAALESEEASQKEGEGDEEAARVTDGVCAFLDLLNGVFWELFSRRPAGASVAPVVNPGA